MNSDYLIDMRQLTKSYYLDTGEAVPVLKGIDFRVKRNEFVAIMGESGSGKSTLLNIIGFLHPPSGGQYLFDGDNVSEMTDSDTLAYIRNQKIGFIFQQFFLLARLNVLENVSLPAIYTGCGKQEREEKALGLIERVGLSEKIHSRPGELSGWQQQRVAIARAIINNPDLLLADEPTGNLDSVTTQDIMKLIMEFKQEGKTIIIVTHTHEVAKHADRIIFLSDGKVVDDDYRLG